MTNRNRFRPASHLHFRACLFHTGLKRMFPAMREAVESILDPARIRWIGFAISPQYAPDGADPGAARRVRAQDFGGDVWVQFLG